MDLLGRRHALAYQTVVLGFACRAKRWVRKRSSSPG